MIDVHGADCKFWKFPTGEFGVQVNSLYPYKAVTIGWDYENDGEILHIANIVNAVRNLTEHVEIVLDIPYLPYSRQDRVCAKGESFSLKVLADIINSLKFDAVYTDDAHNTEVACELIKNLVVNSQSSCANYLSWYDYDLYIAPDNGAALKIKDHRAVVNGTSKVLILSKTRKDGRIIYDDLTPEAMAMLAQSAKAVVVDDIGDGMGTFIALAENLKKSGVKLPVLDLYVTHGFFTKGDDILKPYYNRVLVRNLKNKNVDPDFVQSI